MLQVQKGQILFLKEINVATVDKSEDKKFIFIYFLFKDSKASAVHPSSLPRDDDYWRMIVQHLYMILIRNFLIAFIGFCFVIEAADENEAH